jgi:hypothetical protein
MTRASHSDWSASVTENASLLLDHVNIRDHVALAVPYEAAAGPRGNLLHIEREEIAPQRHARDEDDGWPRAPEHIARPTLLEHELLRPSGPCERDDQQRDVQDDSDTSDH